MAADKKTIPLAIRDLALPVPRTGSIESHSGYGRAASEGREIHGRVQRKRAKADASYEAEVAISAEFLRGSYRFRVEGRMDGIFRGERPHIEEIKTAFGIPELASATFRGPAQPSLLPAAPVVRLLPAPPGERFFPA